jgi:hypothetical protein
LNNRGRQGNLYATAGKEEKRGRKRNRQTIKGKGENGETNLKRKEALRNGTVVTVWKSRIETGTLVRAVS